MNPTNATKPNNYLTPEQTNTLNTALSGLNTAISSAQTRGAIPNTIQPVNTLNATALVNQQPTPKVTPTVSTTATKNLAASVSQYVPTTPETQTTQTTPTPVETPTSKAQARIDEILGIQKGKGADIASAQEEVGLAKKREELNKLDTQALRLNQAYEKEVEAIRKNPEGKFGGAIANDLKEAERVYLDKKADIAISKLAAQGDVDTALKIVEDKINAKYEPLDNEITTLKSALDIYKNDLTESEKLKLQEEISNRESARDLAKQKELENYRAQLDQNDPYKKAQTQKLLAEIAESKGGTTKPLSGEASKLLSISTTLPTDIQKIKEKINKDYKGFLQGYKLGMDRESVKLVNNAADKVGRLRSGGAINKDEEERFKEQFASFGDLAFGTKEEALAALDGLIVESEMVRKGIDPNNVFSNIVQTTSTPVPSTSADTNYVKSLKLRASN